MFVNRWLSLIYLFLRFRIIYIYIYISQHRATSGSWSITTTVVKICHRHSPMSNAQWTVIWRYMQTCPLFSCLHLNSLSVLNCLTILNCLPVQKWPRLSFPCQPSSQCWESQCGVCGRHTPSLNPLPVWISHTSSLSWLFLPSLLLQLRPRWLLSAPLLTLRPPSVRWDRRGSASLHQRHGWSIPCLRLQPMSPGLRLGPSIQWLHHGS